MSLYLNYLDSILIVVGIGLLLLSVVVPLVYVMGWLLIFLGCGWFVFFECVLPLHIKKKEDEL